MQRISAFGTYRTRQKICRSCLRDVRCSWQASKSCFPPDFGSNPPGWRIESNTLLGQNALENTTIPFIDGWRSKAYYHVRQSTSKEIIHAQHLIMLLLHSIALCSLLSLLIVTCLKAIARLMHQILKEWSFLYAIAIIAFIFLSMITSWNSTKTWGKSAIACFSCCFSAGNLCTGRCYRKRTMHWWRM